MVFYFQARISNQISKLERRVKQEITLNQELLEDIKEDKQQKSMV